MTWTATCDVCGFDFKNTELKKRWDGMMVCSKDFELRHPMDFLKVRPEKSQKLPWVRPDPGEIDVGPTYIDTGNNDIPEGTFTRIRYYEIPGYVADGFAEIRRES